jgi:hypothetical protein
MTAGAGAREEPAVVLYSGNRASMGSLTPRKTITRSTDPNCLIPSRSVYPIPAVLEGRGKQ